MSLRINSNIAAMNAYRNLASTDKQMKGSLEKLSSGLRINRAADDAAGLSISQGLQSQIGGLQVAARNAQDGINVVQTADGALGESEAILQRMRDLAVQSSNSGSQDASAQGAAQTEFTQLNSELDRIVSTTKFGSKMPAIEAFNSVAVKPTNSARMPSRAKSCRRQCSACQGPSAGRQMRRPSRRARSRSERSERLLCRLFPRS